jgi:hypothetical protein
MAAFGHPSVASLPPVSTKTRAKTILLPAGRRPRTVKFGVAKGVRMSLDLSHQTRQYLGLYEIELDRHLRRALKPGITTFDVGAQHGYDSLACASRTGAKVAAFECEPECIDRMHESFVLNPRIAPLIEAVHATVGGGPGQLGLDEWAYGPGFVPDFIKLDIEGGEVAALRSATRILTERHPALVIEVHSLDLERQAGELLVGFGYRPLIVSQRTVFPDLRPTAHNRWLVCHS